MTSEQPLKMPAKVPPAGLPNRPVPLPDPHRVPYMPQNKHVTRADQTLETWFHGRREGVLVNGQGYLCPDRRNVRSCPVPDCVVAFDVDPERITETNGYVISEVGKPPEFVLEIASETTGVRDYTVKRDRYAEMRVGEYWRFDHTGGRYHDAALAGDRLVDGGYAPITITEEPDGEIWGYSPALELDLCWRSGQLRFYDPVGKSYLPWQPELKDQRDAAIAERDAALLENQKLRELLRRREPES